MTQPQQEYIITDDQIVKAVSLTDWYNVAVLCREIRSRPHTSTPKTWESCHEHFMCPTGEECWYLSEDYHKDQITAIRNATLDESCNIDLVHYVWGELASEDVRKCEGISCNYCGRYNYG